MNAETKLDAQSDADEYIDADGSKTELECKTEALIAALEAETVLENKVKALAYVLREFDLDCAESHYATALLGMIGNREKAAQEYAEKRALADAFCDKALTHAKCCGLHRSQVEFLQRGRILDWWQPYDNRLIP